ncbi:MAG: hypothetical protein ACRDKV_06295 [Solirubrobacterales bacterium]
MRHRWLLAAALAVAAVAVAAVALVRDDPSSEAIPGFPDHPEGRKPLIFDVGALLYGTEGGIRERAFAEAEALGANAIRMPVLWYLTAPAERPDEFDPADPRDPAYDWSVYDPAVRNAQELGLRVLMMPTGPAPEWAAVPGSDGVGDPDPEEFGQFASALAKRYGGGFDPDRGGPDQPLPGVGIWTIWNEPNLSTFLQPQYRDGRPHSPQMYRELYLAAQAAIHKEHPSAPILIGETAPTGGEQSVDPLTFTRQTLCLNEEFEELRGCPDPDAEIDAVGWSAHPYPLAGQAPFEPVSNPNFVTMSSLASLQAVLDGAAGADAIASDLPIYITEFGVQSFPDPNAVSLQKQAGFIGIAEHFAYTDPRVATFAQYLMNDDSPENVPGELYGGFESGVRFHDGRKKPSYDALRLPLAVQQLGGKVSLWGILQPYPHPTTVRIRYKNPGGEGRDLQEVTTDAVGIYTTTYGDFPERQWQAVWRSPEDGKTYRSPWIRSYEYAAPR